MLVCINVIFIYEENVTVRGSGRDRSTAFPADKSISCCSIQDDDFSTSGGGWLRHAVACVDTIVRSWGNSPLVRTKNSVGFSISVAHCIVELTQDSRNCVIFLRQRLATAIEFLRDAVPADATDRDVNGLQFRVPFVERMK